MVIEGGGRNAVGIEKVEKLRGRGANSGVLKKIKRVSEESLSELGSC